MKRRARRVTLAAAVLGGGVVAVLTVAHWGTVRDHVKAWHFQLTRETETIGPDLAARVDQEGDEMDRRSGQRLPSPRFDAQFDHESLNTFQGCQAWYLVSRLSSSDVPVIFESERRATKVWWTQEPASPSTHDRARRILTMGGWRVLEQRFPRRAYVVIGD